MNNESMTRGQVADLLKINFETLRYYEKIGLITPLKNENNGYRYYDEDLVSKLELIISFKRLGFTLNEIKDFFDIIKTSVNDSSNFSHYINEKVLDIDSKITALVNMKQSLLKFKSKEDKTTCELFSKFLEMN